MMDDIDLVAAADAIVVAEVVDTRTFQSAEHAGAILTEATLAIRQVVTGDAPETVTVRTFGGEIPGSRQEFHGAPTFEPGQVQLAMLYLTPDGAVQVAGYRQGQYRVVRRSDGVRVALPMIGDAHFVSKDGGPVVPPRALPLDSLVHHLRTVRGELDAVLARSAGPSTDHAPIR
jgi:hypothetical protein